MINSITGFNEKKGYLFSSQTISDASLDASEMEYSRFDKLECGENNNILADDSVKLPLDFMTECAFIKDKDGQRLGQKLQAVFEQYYANAADVDDIKRVINNTVDIIGQYYVDCGYKKEDIISDIIEDVYGRARYDNIASAGLQSWKDGKKYAAIYDGHGQTSDDWIYYDSKYYYASEKMKFSLQSIAQEIGESYGAGNLNLPTEYDQNTQPELYSMFNSYNSYTNFQMCDNHCNGKIIDESAAPPEDFRFFYKGNTSGTNCYTGVLASNNEDTVFDSVLHIWYKNWTYIGRVPTYSIEYSQLSDPAINMYDTVVKEKQIPDEIADFMKQCIFYSPYFSEKYKRHI